MSGPTLPSRCIGIACKKTRFYDRWLELRKQATNKEAQRLLHHRDPVVRAVFAAEAIKRGLISRRLLYPLLSDTTELKRFSGCTWAEVTIWKHTLTALSAAPKTVRTPLLVDIASDRELLPDVRRFARFILAHGPQVPLRIGPGVGAVDRRN